MAQPIRNTPRSTGNCNTPCPTPATTECQTEQIPMHRYIYSTPCQEQSCCSYGPLLRAAEQQNLLLTELLSAVNSLTAILCARQDP